jgi:hypothetical protein
MSDEGKITDCNFFEFGIGKKIAKSKMQYIWEFNFSGRRYKIEMLNSRLTNKKEVIANGKVLLPARVYPGIFSHSFIINDGLTISIVQSGRSFELRVNNFPFNHLIELQKNKALFAFENKKETSHTYRLSPIGKVEEVEEFENKEDRIKKRPDIIISSQEVQDHFRHNFSKGNKENIPINKPFNFNIKPQQGLGNSFLRKGSYPGTQAPSLISPLNRFDAKKIKEISIIKPLEKKQESFENSIPFAEISPRNLIERELEKANVEKPYEAPKTTKNSEINLEKDLNEVFANFNFKESCDCENRKEGREDFSTTYMLNSQYVNPVPINQGYQNEMKNITSEKTLNITYIPQSHGNNFSSHTITSCLDKMDNKIIKSPNRKENINENLPYPTFTDIHHNKLNENPLKPQSETMDNVLHELFN